MNPKEIEVAAGITVRKFTPKKGDFLLVRYDADEMIKAKGGRDQAEASIVDVAKRLTMHPALKGVYIITMPAGMDLQHLPPQDMAGIGWVRKELAPRPVWLSCTRCNLRRIGTADMVGWKCQAVRTEGGVCDGEIFLDGEMANPKGE